MAWAVSCRTYPGRNPAFEAQVAAFIDASIPCSRMRLFNATDLSGWQVRGWGIWRVEDGVLRGTRGLGYLATRFDRIGDFVLTLEARVSNQGNSGIFFRAKPPGAGLRPWPIGYEAQINHHDPRNPTGSLYNRVPARALGTKDEEWFSMEIRSIAEHHSVFVNGTLAAELQDADFREGFIAFQAHDPLTTAEFRNITLQMPCGPNAGAGYAR